MILVTPRDPAGQDIARIYRRSIDPPSGKQKKPRVGP